MLQQDHNTPTVPPIWTLGPLSFAWYTRRTKPGALGCDGTVGTTRMSSCVSGWAYPFVGGKSCPENSKLVLPRCCPH